jgi:predicted transcriptional regulator
MMSKKTDVDAVIKKAVAEAVNAGIMAGRRMPMNAYKETERRLYAYLTLLERVADNIEKLEEIKSRGPREFSKSLIRFTGSGQRLTTEEIAEALTRDLAASIAADDHEIETVSAALLKIKNDPYYLAVYGKFIEGMTDDDIAAKITCDPSTVRRNRGRLVRKLAVLLYGSQAV